MRIKNHCKKAGRVVYLSTQILPYSFPMLEQGGEAQLSDSSLKHGSLACRIRGELRFGLGAAFVKPHSSYDLDTLSAGTLFSIRLLRPLVEAGSTQRAPWLLNLLRPRKARGPSSTAWCNHSVISPRSCQSGLDNVNQIMQKQIPNHCCHLIRLSAEIQRCATLLLKHYSIL